MRRALLLTLVAASYLLLAGGPRWAYPPLLGLAAICVAVAPRATLGFPSATRPLDLMLVVCAGALLLQILPLPAMLVSLVSPHAQSLRAQTRFAIADSGGGAWLPFTIDAGATAYALATFVLGVLSFWIARATFAVGGTRQFCRILGLLAAVAAVVALVQKAIAPGVLMGVVTPDARSANPLGAFVNRNHFAAWLLMGSTASAGYLMAHLQIHPAYRLRLRQAAKHFFTSGALLSGLAIFITVGTLLLTLSRSAAAGLSAAALTAGWLGRRRIRLERTNAPAVAVLVGIALLLGAAFIDIDAWMSRLQHSWGLMDAGGFSRMTIWRESLPIMRDFPLTGTGAGTYGAAMAEYQQTRPWVGSMQQFAHFNNAHSHYVQLAVEGGLLLTLPVIAAMALVARLGLKAIRADNGEMFWMRIGAASGLVGLAVQSIWEVALLLPANAVMAGVLAGLLLHRRIPSVRSETPTPLWNPPVSARRV